MKGMNLIIVILVVGLCLLGWVSMATQTTSDANEYEAYIEQADAWMAEGLYQRAILSYQSALATEPTVEIYTKAIAAYKARMAEVEDEVLEQTQGDYEEFLVEAVAKYPEEVSFVETLGRLYLDAQDYKDAFACLYNAVQTGVKSDEVLKMLTQARYAWSFSGSTYSAILALDAQIYTVARTGRWGTYDVEEGRILPFDYLYVGRTNEDGMVVVTSEKDSRLMGEDNMVLGIFEKKVVDAGVFAEDLIAASFDGVTYDYYDEFASRQFGGYQMAGTFQDGKAAVKQGNVWFLINTKGEKVSNEFAHIVLNLKGEYLSSDVILAAEKPGKYAFYDKEFEKIADIDATAVDICTEDGLVAFCKNDKWGFVDKKGNVIIAPKYEMARSFSHGLAAVCLNGYWGFIDQGGNLVIETQFRDALYFSEFGICGVRTDMPEEVIEETEPDESNEAEQENEDGETKEEEIIYEEWKLLKLKNGIVED